MILRNLGIVLYVQGKLYRAELLVRQALACT